jgi:hypothetical protein
LAIVLVFVPVLVGVLGGPGVVDQAAAVPTLALTVQVVGSGTVDPVTEGTLYELGTPVQLTASAAIGWHFVDWSGDASGSANPVTVTMDADKTVTATFAINTFTLTYGAGLGGTLSGDASQTVGYGGSGTAVTAVPNTGYHFVGWSDAVPTATRTDVSVTTNHSVTAAFAINTFTIAVSAGANGSITPGTGLVDYGTSPTYAITPATGYHIATLTVDGVARTVQGSWTFTSVAADHTMAATFAIDTFTITVISGTNGSITSPGTGPVDYGASREFIIIPDDNYRVEDVLVDGVSQGPVTGFTLTNVTGAHTIKATFTPGDGTRFDNLTLAGTVVTYGSGTTITATIKAKTLPAQDTPITGGSVTVLSAARLDGGWTSVETVTPSSDPGSEGTCSAQVKPLGTTYYRLLYTPEKGTTYASTVSGIVFVRVRPLLGKLKRPSTVKAGKYFTVSGTIAPRFSKGSKTVQVKAYRLKGAHWRLAKRLAAVNANSGSASKYSVRLKLTKKGTYRFGAVFAATSDWAGATSAYSGKMRVR